MKAQAIYYKDYKVDILDMSSLALKISIKVYYDPETFPIHIPSKNEDRFIRRGYYGGHAESYIPCGENFLLLRRQFFISLCHENICNALTYLESLYGIVI